MSSQPNTSTLDPRGTHKTRSLQLAKRSLPAALESGKVLFFDNTKLRFCNYNEIYTRLTHELNKHGIHSIVRVCQSVRGTMTEDMRKLAASLALENYTAAIVALADMGTSVMTTILAIELEKVGIPTVLIASPPGNQLAEHVAHYRAGQLCICHLDIYQASTHKDIAQQVLRQKDFILQALSAPPDKLHRLAKLHPQMDTAPLQCDKAILSDDIDVLMHAYETLSIGDGLPVVPPSQGRFKQMLRYCCEPLDTIVIPEAGPSGKNITLHDIVINTILAGCKPAYLPIIIAAFRAMAHSAFNFQQSMTSSYNGGNLVLVSGPIAQELGIHSGQGCLGPGFRANATIGRAINLTILNVCRAYPGKADLGCLGSPAEFTYCFAESIDNSPWSTLNEEHFDRDTTTVYLLKAEPPTDVVDFLSQTADSLLETLIDSATHLGRMNAYIPGRILIVLTPDHARILQKDGWHKHDLRVHFHHHIHNPSTAVNGKGLVPVRPTSFAQRDPIPATRHPNDIDIVVAGGRGGHSAIIASWGLYSDAVLTPLTLPNGQVARSIKEFDLTIEGV
ncbi:UGSC family (seleno)protein [Zooshikella sp. RANM57]|uniref:UGSC family (seleno)protein n=1 Tax=Zooshikella sp. RANM57 TaxID=3425863 RepID=UPI003D6F3B85